MAEGKANGEPEASLLCGLAWLAIQHIGDKIAVQHRDDGPDRLPMHHT